MEVRPQGLRQSVGSHDARMVRAVAPAARQLPQADRRLSRPVRIQRARRGQGFHPRKHEAASTDDYYMEIPYTVNARPDTVFRTPRSASGSSSPRKSCSSAALFSAYIFLRMGADAGHGRTRLHYKLGPFNTIVLICSSVTMLAWASLKLNRFDKYKLYQGITLICAVVFLSSNPTNTTTSSTTTKSFSMMAALRTDTSTVKPPPPTRLDSKRPIGRRTNPNGMDSETESPAHGD